MEFLKWLLTGLVPPRSAGGNQVYRWQVAVAVMVMSNSLAIIGLSMLAFGTVPVIFQGFAHTSDATVNSSKVMDIERNQLDTNIMDTRTRQCASITQKNEGALLFATSRLQAELEAWARLVGPKQPYRLPGCEEL